MASSQGKQIIDGSSIIDMEAIDGDDSDYETNLAGDISKAPIGPDEEGHGRKRTKEQTSSIDDIQQKVTQNVASYVWQSGSKQAKSVFNNYANVDLLRPYFNVEPHEVRQRLLHSLIPKKPSSRQQKVPRELYGPTMLVFTLIALLLYQMKTGGHTVQEGTLMGTAFGTCFGYWFGVSSFVWFLAYVCNAHITMLQLLSLLGYALFGHCIVVGLTTVFHTSHDHMFFYLIWAFIGGASTLKMVSVLVSRTAGHTQRIIVCGTLAFFHLCFLLYLHFAYHQMVEELSDMIEHAGPPHPGLNHPMAANHKIAERAAEQNMGNVIPTKPPQVAGDPARVPKAQVPAISTPIGGLKAEGKLAGDTKAKPIENEQNQQQNAGAIELKKPTEKTLIKKKIDTEKQAAIINALQKDRKV